MSTLKVTNIQATGETATRAVSGVAAAWVAAVGSDASIRSSMNISSATDNGTGRYYWTLTNAFTGVEDFSQVATLRTATDGAVATRDAGADAADRLACEASDSGGTLTDFGVETLGFGDLA